MRANARHQRRARTSVSDKPCMRDMLIARPLHAFVIFALWIEPFNVRLSLLENRRTLNLQSLIPDFTKRDNAGLQRRGANPLKLGRRKHHEEEAIAASAASLCSGAPSISTFILLIANQKSGARRKRNNPSCQEPSHLRYRPSPRGCNQQQSLALFYGFQYRDATERQASPAPPRNLLERHATGASGAFRC